METNYSWLLLSTSFTAAAAVENEVTGQEIGLEETCGDDNQARSLKEFDYCDEELCRFEGETSPRKHVACVENDTLQSQCPPNSTLIEFTRSEKKVILSLHNKIRNFIASGNHSSYKPAAKMQAIEWDKSLAFVSSFNVRTCEFQHDSCRNTKKFRYSGQNLGIRTTSQRATNRKEIFKHVQALINLWILEGDLYCNQQFIDAFQPHPNANFQIGHFTEMVRDENTYVGCSAMEFEDETNWSYLLACNYATNNFLGEPVYVSGPSCSACSSGCHNKFYKALCSENSQNLLH